MAFSWEARGGTHKELKWSDFLKEYQCSSKGGTATDIVRCLRALLEKFEESEFIKYLVAPSPSSLAQHFQIPLTQVYQALQDLQRQGYEAETGNHHAPIILWDPLIRAKTARSINPGEQEIIPNLENRD